MPILGVQHGGTRGLRLRWPALHPTARGRGSVSQRARPRAPAGPGLGRLGRWRLWMARAAGSAMETLERRAVGEGGSGPRARPPRSSQPPDGLVPVRQNEPLSRQCGQRPKGQRRTGAWQQQLEPLVASGGRRQHAGPMGRAAALGKVCWLITEGRA